MTKIYHVIVSKTVGQKWEVEAESEEDAKQNYSRGKKIKENDHDIYPEEAELISNDRECGWCGLDMVVKEDKLYCEECKAYKDQLDAEGELSYDEYKCPICSYDRNLEGDTLICQHCGESTTLQEHRKNLQLKNQKSGCEA